MNYFNTNLDVAACKSFIKSLKAKDYEYCIVALKNNVSIIISNCENLTQKLSQESEFTNISVHQNNMSEIHEYKQYKTTHGNHGLLIDSLS
jgi:rRNA-processing protein FCF1